MKPRIQLGEGISGCVRYASGEGLDPKTGVKKEFGPGQESRVEWFGGTGFSFNINNERDVELARKIMEYDALHQSSTRTKCLKDCVHISLSWERGETPDRDEIREAVQGALEAIGMGNAKALFFVHSDEDYAHAHIVASKIRPDNGYAYDLLGSQRKLSVWAEEFERTHGGIVTIGRALANELRRAIAARDPGAVLEALTKQRSTFTQQQLVRPLEKEIYWKIGASAEDKRAVEEERARFAKEILAHPDVLRLADSKDGPITRYTTRAVYEAEQYVLNAAAALDASDRHEVADREFARVLKSSRYQEITEEQVIALRHATGAKGLALIDGMAGTGKSYVMAAIRDAYQGAGHHVIGLGPTNKVAIAMSTDGFADAKTIHRELVLLNNGRTSWNGKTVVMIDEAAMVDTRLMAMVTAHAHDAGAKLILVGDDRQLSSIDRGGMFGSLKQRYGAAELTKVRRQYKNDDRRASEMMSEGNFDAALKIYEQQHRIHWTTTQRAARTELVEQWAKDSAAHPHDTRFIFAYTNRDVDLLNAAVRTVRKERGELTGEDRELITAHGRACFAAGDRIQFTGTNKYAGFTNGEAGIIVAIDGSHLAVRLDGDARKTINFDAAQNPSFRHGYAGTIYKGQGATLDRVFLFHSDHWRAAPSYVALTRHRAETTIFVARNTAKDLAALAKQIARPDDRRAATQFYCRDGIDPISPKTAQEILARFSDPGFDRGQRETGEGGEGDPATAASGQRFYRQDNAEPSAAKEPRADPAADETSGPPDERQPERQSSIRAAMRKVRAILRRLRPRKSAHDAGDGAADAVVDVEDTNEADEQVNDAAEVVAAIEPELQPEASPDGGEDETCQKPAAAETDAYLAALLAEAEILRERDEAERPVIVRQHRAGRGRSI